MESTGVSLDERTWDWIDEYRQRDALHGEDTPLNRSEAVRQLLALAQVCDDMIAEGAEEGVLAMDSPRGRQAWVRQALLTGLAAERRES